MVEKRGRRGHRAYVKLVSDNLGLCILSHLGASKSMLLTPQFLLKPEKSTLSESLYGWGGPPVSSKHLYFSHEIKKWLYFCSIEGLESSSVIILRFGWPTGSKNVSLRFRDNKVDIPPFFRRLRRAMSSLLLLRFVCFHGTPVGAINWRTFLSINSGRNSNFCVIVTVEFDTQPRLQFSLV